MRPMLLIEFKPDIFMIEALQVFKVDVVIVVMDAFVDEICFELILLIFNVPLTADK